MQDIVEKCHSGFCLRMVCFPKGNQKLEYEKFLNGYWFKKRVGFVLINTDVDKLCKEDLLS